MDNNNGLEIATFGGGCFWCTEAIFKRLKGVVSVISGYAGGDGGKPTYDIVSSGNSGYTEAVEIVFDPKIIQYEKLLEVFWATHNPTTLNRQGADVGTQYRSVIFYHNDEQKNQAMESKLLFSKSGEYTENIVTEIEPLTNFYQAEDYHQNYYENNQDINPYCSIVIDPKLDKLIKQFNNYLKEDYL